MKVYISASDDAKAREAALLLGTVLGHEVVSRWHLPGQTRPKFKDGAGWAERVAQNLTDIERADVLVAFPEGQLGCYGSQVEVGYALRGGTPIILHARKLPSALLRHPLIHHSVTADQLEAKVKELAEQVTSKPAKTTKRRVKTC